MQLTITTFTDPMMGLSYECYPIFRKLETHFPGNLKFPVVMCCLVRDVHALLDPADLPHGEAYAIERYNHRLARIYESEEPISGMPINMAGFQLFSPEHISSMPLDLAYKAAELTCREKAEYFLYRLRFATIVETRPTTRWQELLHVAKACGLNEEAFTRNYTDGSAQLALDKDLALCQSLGIHQLPAYQLSYGDKSLLVQGLVSYQGFVEYISELSDGRMREERVSWGIETVRSFLRAHPLISPIELCEAFDMEGPESVIDRLHPLFASGELVLRAVARGVFIASNCVPKNSPCKP